MKRELRWNKGEFVHTDYNGEEICDWDGCIELIDDYPGLSSNSFVWPLHVWEGLAEHILRERDKRRGEVEKQPKRWLVDVIAGTAERHGDESKGRAQAGVYFRANRDEAERLIVWAKDEKDAIRRAQEANHSLGVWIREYLA